MKSHKMRDSVCEAKLNVVCKVPPSIQYQLKGVCISSPIDSFYVANRAYELIGFTQTSLVFENTTQRWEIRFTSNKSLLAHTETSELPIGTHAWFFEEKCSEFNKTYRNLLLHLNVEQPGNFCCGDGSCISSEEFCDQKIHCPDRYKKYF